MSLASKLPWNHRFAGGYPGLSSQPLPTDADAIDYLSRMATADGAGVDTSVAVAVDAFFRDTKAAGVFDALKACCILAGARTITGALVPLAGTAPTSNGFVSGDYSRTDGLTGDGTSYIDSGRAGDDDPQNDHHISTWVSSASSTGSPNLIGTDGVSTAGGTNLYEEHATASLAGASRGTGSSSGFNIAGGHTATGLKALSRSSASSYVVRVDEANTPATVASQPPTSRNYFVFARNDATSPPQFVTDATIAFYSIGTSLGTDPGDGLAALDTAVTNLMTAIGNESNVPLDGGGSGANVAPTVTLQPTNETASEGGTATFTSAASGTPTPTVQWQLSTDGGSSWADIGGATATSYTTPTLLLSDDQNQYRAVWTNSEGTATSNAATLTVTVAVVGSSLWILDAYPPVFHWST